MRKKSAGGAIALAMALAAAWPASAQQRQTGAAEGTVRRVDTVFTVGANQRRTTVDLRPDDRLASSVCGKKLFFAEGGDWIQFDCNGKGQYHNATGVPPNSGSLEWGFRLADDNASLVIKTFREFGFAGLETPAAHIIYRFTSGIAGVDQKTAWNGALGLTPNGTVALVFGHIPAAGWAYVSK